MRTRACDRCRSEMEAFGDAPCCLHQPACAIWFCSCGRVWYRGPCAREALRENPLQEYFTMETTPAVSADDPDPTSAVD